MGIKGKDFVMVCSDTSAVQQIINLKDDEEKLVPIDSHKIMALSGEPGSRVQFSEYIIANTRLYALRNSTKLSTKAVAHYTRLELATALRKVRPTLCPAGPRLVCVSLAVELKLHTLALPAEPLPNQPSHRRLR